MKILFFAIILSVPAFASDSMTKNLEALNIPDDQISPTISRDKLFVLNTRYSSLTNRHEASIFGGNNFTAPSHMEQRAVGLTYRYHINPKWSVGLRHTEYYNNLNNSGKTLLGKEALVAETDFAKSSNEIFGSYNLFYGKMRMTHKTVVYFDQFISLGAGKIDLASGSTNSGILDLGIAFWMGSHMSARIGLKNEFYKQTLLNGDNNNVHNANGYVEFGYLFGEGSKI
jgi:outer membrane beta-barrel protein